MRSATTYGRWLFMLLIMVGFASTAYAQRNITLRLNTATLPDTLDANDVIQVRGAVEGTGGVTLPDGNVIDWNDGTTLRPDNIGGDNWQLTFQLDNDSLMAFKFYSQLAEDNGVGGWEDGDNHEIAGGSNDSTLALHFFEKGADQPYDWRPFEAKQDSVGIWFRVFACTADGQAKGYDPSDEAQSFAVRGDPLGGASQLTWDENTGVSLARESDTEGQPGYDLYSGVAYYPTSAAGTSQPYKFYLNGTADGWESSDNRTFTIPESDSTLRWVYFGETSPANCSQTPVTADVIFSVDLSAFETIGVFDRARGDTLWTYGGFNGWQNCPATNPDLCLMQREPGTEIFAGAFSLTLIPQVSSQYKYFLDFNDENFRTEFGVDPPSGWEEGHLTGTNRSFIFEGAPNQELGLEFFNDITADNVIPDGTSIDVLFSVDMTPALTDDAQPFDPAMGDSVSIRLGDPIFAFTQGLNQADGRPGDAMPVLFDTLLLTDDDNDNVYTGTLTLAGPTYSNLTFKYVYGQGATFTEEVGTDTGVPGRNRTYYIRPNSDGSWPATYELPAATFDNQEGPLPFEANPALATGVEVIDGEVPETVWLGANYPNPFNPTTTFEYAIDRTQNVTIRVYDVMGRVVATLVDGVQPASTYQVTFDASHMASGVYFYRLQTQSHVVSKRMLLVK